MKLKTVFTLVCLILFSSCSSEVPPRLGGNDYFREYDVGTKNTRAEKIAGFVSSRFGKKYPLRNLAFKLNGREAKNHSDVLLEFVSRTYRLGGIHFPSKAEFAIEVRTLPKPLKAVRGAYNMHVSVRIVAIRPVAHGSQTIVKSSGQGQCSYKLRSYRRCDRLIAKILSNIVYEMH
jgi:hypothetical protein